MIGISDWKNSKLYTVVDGYSIDSNLVDRDDTVKKQELNVISSAAKNGLSFLII